MVLPDSDGTLMDVVRIFFYVICGRIEHGQLLGLHYRVNAKED